MTKYEFLMKKAELCNQSAKKTKGYMRSIWQRKAIELQNLAKSLSIKEAEKILK